MNSKNNNKSAEFLVYKPEGSKLDERKRRRSEDSPSPDVKERAETPRRGANRGTWTNDRRLRLLTSFVERDPLGVPHGEGLD